MGRRPKQTCLHKRHTDGQQTYEKMLITANYQRNPSQNYNEVPPHTDQNGHHLKSLQMTNVGEGVQKKEPSYAVGGNINWCSNYREEYGGSLKN